MGLFEQISQDLAQAMKSGDKLTLSVLRMLKSDLKYKQIEIGRELKDEDCLAVFSSAAKKRQDSIESYIKGGRQDLADIESAELEIIKKYLPQQLSESELEQVIGEVIAEIGASSPSDLGAVMKALMPKVKGKADGRRINEIVRKKLGG
ncbi:MAG: GatB/YqeY domain-containing protein [candidate division Zixibacteria bacterium]|nr:GatB/YqeY domain-containing protein [candidate division Zixibacteria bacterium]